ncbi:hypothetical protein FIBSPDRAFT_958297 [Athelia psychrophila]|uniref:Uncharacterized protein n=1 Tax=Athelia psychrophila TaxID=1759441 RepID=A0A166EUI6_9AGAM|nr:hypothetical protein FIBSPDRAFT_958297 [Fibularhizoctonia sp. CBS 109695]
MPNTASFFITAFFRREVSFASFPIYKCGCCWSEGRFAGCWKIARLSLPSSMSHQESAVAVLEHYRDVKNTRVHDGNEVAQVYLGFPRSRASRRGFERSFLKKGQSAQFSIGEANKISRQVASHNVFFPIGFDTAFILLSSTIPPTVSNPNGYGSGLAVTPSFNLSSCLEEITLRIMDQATGIELQMYHSEAAPGQYEIVIGPMSPVQAFDALV